MSNCNVVMGKDSSRQSKFPMIEVDDAIKLILEISTTCQSTNLIDITRIAESNCYLAEDLYSIEDFPSFPASIMDGYAVHAPIESGIFEIEHHIHAGTNPMSQNTNSKVSYITTGAMLPQGTNAVVKIEDTESVSDQETNKSVRIAVSIQPGVNVRQIGSDIQRGELILSRGQKIGPAELGLLATIGKTNVLCYHKPVIGIMSTGDELIEPMDTPIGSQIRDSNRIALMAAFQEDGFRCIDLGIIRDQQVELKQCLQEASTRCDVVITTGGVSMGEKDYVKPLLEELGQIHFGRINMKPGKPTTFATIFDKTRNKNILFFGLPGNPVSCLVTKSLMIDPALKRLQGCNSLSCLHTQIQVLMKTKDIQIDPERPEYHRVSVYYDLQLKQLVASSTGNQRSSRLLSMRSANALLCLPKGNGVVKQGEMVTALLLKQLQLSSDTYSNVDSLHFHHHAASLDFLETSKKNMKMTDSSYESFDKILSTSIKKDNSSNSKGEGWRHIQVAVLTVSDRAFKGIYADESGPELCRLMLEMSKSPDWPLSIDIVATAIVPDDIGMIQNQVTVWASPQALSRVDLVLTTGGTGFGLRDLTPEAIKPLLHREAPGIAQCLINEGLKYTNLAVLSRPVVGTRFNTLICTFPGSVKAIKENVHALKPLLPRIMELLKENTCSV